MWDIFRPSKDIRGYLDKSISNDYLTLFGKVMTIVAIYESRLKLVSVFLEKSENLKNGFDGYKHSKESLIDAKKFMDKLTTYRHIDIVTGKWENFFDILDKGRLARNEIVHDNMLNFYPIGISQENNDISMQSVLLDMYPKIEKISHAISALDFLANISSVEITHKQLSNSIIKELSQKCFYEKNLLRDWYINLDNINIKVFPIIYKYLLERK